MSFCKSLFLAILATILLTYLFGTSLLEWLSINSAMDLGLSSDLSVYQQVIDPIKSISVSALVVIALILIATFLVLSVFGTLMFVTLLLVGTIFMLFVGLFWPVLLVATVLLWLVTRNKAAIN